MTRSSNSSRWWKMGVVSGNSIHLPALRGAMIEVEKPAQALTTAHRVPALHSGASRENQFVRKSLTSSRCQRRIVSGVTTVGCGEGRAGRSGARAPPAADADHRSVECDGRATAPSGPVLFAMKIDDSMLLTLHLSKERHEQEVEWKHASESIRIEVGAVSDTKTRSS